jgi:hypothetical protein
MKTIRAKLVEGIHPADLLHAIEIGFWVDLSVATVPAPSGGRSYT